MSRQSQIFRLAPTPGDQPRAKVYLDRVEREMEARSQSIGRRNYVCNCNMCNGKEFKTIKGLREHYQTKLANECKIPMLLCIFNGCLSTSTTKSLLISHFARNHIKEAGFKIVEKHKESKNGGKKFVCILLNCSENGKEFFRGGIFDHYLSHHKKMSSTPVEIESKSSSTSTSSDFYKTCIVELNRFYLYNSELVKNLFDSVVKFMCYYDKNFDLSDAGKNNTFLNLCGRYCIFFSEMIELDSLHKISSKSLTFAIDRELPESCRGLLDSNPEEDLQLKLWVVVIKKSLPPKSELSPEKIVDLSRQMAFHCSELGNQFLILATNIRRLDPSQRLSYGNIDKTDNIENLIREKIGSLPTHSVCQPN